MGLSAWSAQRAGLAFRLVSAHVMKKRKINTLRETSTLLFSTVFSQRIQLSIWPISMDVWTEAAGVDGRKQVENYQERILWQFFNDVISNSFLDSLIPPLNGFNAKISAKVSVKFTRYYRTGLNRRHSWIQGIHAMAHRCLFVCVGTWLDFGDPLFDPVQMDSGDSLNGFHAKDQCKVSAERLSVIWLTSGERNDWLYQFVARVIIII